MPAVTYEHIKTCKQSGARLELFTRHMARLKHQCLCLWGQRRQLKL